MNIRGLQKSASFIEYTKVLAARLEETRTALEIEKDDKEIFRKQGEIAALRYVLALPETIEENARLENLEEEGEEDIHEYE